MTQSGLSRRAFIRAAIAVGGVSALAACMNQEETVPQASTEPADLPTRQHAWNEFCSTDDQGNVRPPKHHLLLGLTLQNDGEPTTDDRERLEASFETIEQAYERGNDGLAFTIGYSPRYFERFGTDPTDVDLPELDALTPFEDPAFDDSDALLHLASDYGSVLLGTEEALAGTTDRLNGLEVTATLEDVFAITDRRTGFVGDGLPAEKADDGISGLPTTESIPEDAPFFMGFMSGLRESQASEDRVTIDNGPFAGGTTTHLSQIRIDLRQWYDQDSREQRIAKMYSPGHLADDLVEGAGHNLGTDTGVDATEATVEADARSGVVGHAQKAARAREDGEPLILRRDMNTTDGDEIGLHFLTHQRTIEAFIRTREAMTATDLESSTGLSRANNGILQYLRVRRRGNYLVPPRDHRSLPTPDPV